MFMALVLGSLLACQQPPRAEGPALNQRLLQEKSPYLRQHADNAVAGYPWGEEAFAKARKEGKPIFLSVGYSTCHWCHVMEKESFMNEEVGKMLNQHFVPIKVDRETRPDVDRLYMNYVAATTGGGGWPMSVFLTPNLEPFFGGTYYPQPSRFGRPSFLTVLNQIHRAWTEKHEEVVKQAAEIRQALAATAVSESGAIPEKASLDQVVGRWKVSFDEKRGGFGEAPKFPQPATLELMLRYGRRHPDSGVEKMVFETLKAMALGGIRDHLEGGFHRYSTDAEWLVPHFEKMLYDQALLVQLYSDAYAWTGEPLYAEAVTTTLDYLLARMTHPEGGFYSAEDADSTIPGSEDHAEGAFYVWTLEEVNSVLGEEAGLAVESFGLTAKGNASGDASGELEGKNVLRLTAVDEKLGPLVEKLRTARSKRPRPARDDKILTAWNAMAVTALARASRQLERPDYLEAARRCMTFLESSLKTDQGWKRSFLEGSAEVEAFATDYAELVGAYLELYRSSGEPEFLQKAVDLQKQQDELFGDTEGGGYWDTRASSELLYRDKEKHDGSTWSANSRSAANLLSLYRLTGEVAYREQLESLFKGFASDLKAHPMSMPGLHSVLVGYHGGYESVILVGDQPDWWKLSSQGYHPERHVVWLRDPGRREQLTPLMEHIWELPKKTAAYICKDFVCGRPITDLEGLRKSLP